MDELLAEVARLRAILRRVLDWYVLQGRITVNDQRDIQAAIDNGTSLPMLIDRRALYEANLARARLSLPPLQEHDFGCELEPR